MRLPAGALKCHYGLSDEVRAIFFIKDPGKSYFPQNCAIECSNVCFHLSLPLFALNAHELDNR